MNRRKKLFYGNLINGLFFAIAFYYITVALLRHSLIGHYSISTYDIYFLLTSVLLIIITIFITYIIPALFIIQVSFNISLKPSNGFVSEISDFNQCRTNIKNIPKNKLCVFRC